MILKNIIQLQHNNQKKRFYNTKEIKFTTKKTDVWKQNNYSGENNYQGNNAAESDDTFFFCLSMAWNETRHFK